MVHDTLHLTAVIRSEEDGYVSHCAELGIASQGDTVEEAKAMLQEALEIYLEDAPLDEIDYLLGGKSESFPVHVTGLQVAVPAGESELEVHPPRVTVG